MAIDSLAKRESALLDAMLTPDGTLGDSDRVALLGQYAFSAAAAVGARATTIKGKLTARLATGNSTSARLG